MLEFIRGNIFNSTAQALINPVNTKGVSGKGLAYQFKQRYPESYKIYNNRCMRGELDVGYPLNFNKENEKIIIDFPTKREWRKPSKIEYIEEGLKQLTILMEKENINSVAIPPLGAGNGRLDWELVKEKIIEFSTKLDKKKYKIIVYEPDNNILKLNQSHLFLINALNGINEHQLKNSVNDFIFQKLIYLTDFIQNRNHFNFKKELKGPFSKLINILYADLKKYKNINKASLKVIEKELEKTFTSNNIETNKNAVNISLDFLIKLIVKFQLSSKESIENKIELASTVLYLINDKNNDELNYNRNKIINGVKSWNKRKENLFLESDIIQMIDFLESESFLKKTLLSSYEINNEINKKSKLFDFENPEKIKKILRHIS